MSEKNLDKKGHKKGLSYKDAGVDIDAGDALVESLKPLAKRSMRPEVLAGIGGFGAFVGLPTKYKEPILVSATDGVGTKLLLAQTLKKHEGIGIDLVAMCVNDVVVSGAEPLFFLDYFASSRLVLDTANTILKSITEGCLLAGCALVGGETAEMPGVYKGEDYDLAGFCVGVVEKTQIINGSAIQAGDILIGLPSSGPHANGFSLIRHILNLEKTDLNQVCGNTSLGEALLAPTRIYVSSLLALAQAQLLKGAAHITGGGLLENIPRMLPDAVAAHIDASTWSLGPVFEFLKKAGNLSDKELLRTFNCGIGMVVCVAAKNVDKALACLRSAGENPILIGHISEKTAEQKESVVITDF